MCKWIGIVQINRIIKSNNRLQKKKTSSIYFEDMNSYPNFPKYFLISHELSRAIYQLCTVYWVVTIPLDISLGRGYQWWCPRTCLNATRTLVSTLCLFNGVCMICIHQPMIPLFRGCLREHHPSSNLMDLDCIKYQPTYATVGIDATMTTSTTTTTQIL